MTESKIDLKRFKLFSNDGSKNIDISKGIVQIKYYESILEYSVKVSATYVDAGKRNEADGRSSIEEGDVNLQFGEKVHLLLEDDNNNKLSFINDSNNLEAQSCAPIGFDTQKLGINLVLTSKGYNEETLIERRVNKPYEGKISDTIKKILEEHLKTEKDFDIEDTQNNLKIEGRIDEMGSPFRYLTWLAKRSVPNISSSLGFTAGFFFFETSEGYKFKSIDKLLAQESKKKLIFNNTTSLPNGYDSKILSAPQITMTASTRRKLLRGTYFTEKKTFNPFTQTYESLEQDIQSQEKAIEKAAKNIVFLPSNLEKKASRLSSYTLDVGNLPTGTSTEKQLENSKVPNFDLQKILVEAEMRYNQLFELTMTFTIFADLTLHAGDIVECYFPEISSRKVQTISNKYSGKYLIVDLCHYISTNGPSYTKLRVARDSYGRT